MSQPASCELCVGDGGEVLWRHPSYRVVLVDEPSFPGFCRVIWQEHVKEMTDLAPADRTLIANAVWAVEAALHEVLQPAKVNLATLGNMTPHVHWHVIPRFEDDTHFPSPVWAEARRPADEETLAPRRAKLAQLREAVGRHMMLAGLPVL